MRQIDTRIRRVLMGVVTVAFAAGAVATTSTAVASGPAPSHSQVIVAKNVWGG